MITWNCYNYIVEITWNCYKYIVIITRNCDIVIMTKLWNIKLCNQRTLPTHRILQEDRSAFNCARFIEIRLVIHESLKVAVVAFKVPTSWKEHCKISTLDVCVLLGVAFLVLSVFANEVIATSSDRYFKVVTTNVFFRFFYIVHADKGFVVGSSDLSFSCKNTIKAGGSTVRAQNVDWMGVGDGWYPLDRYDY